MLWPAAAAAEGLGTLPPAAADAGHSIQKLLPTHRLQQIFAASTTHGLYDQVGLSVCRDRENRSFRRSAMNIFGSHCRPATVTVEIHQADIGRRIAEPIAGGIRFLHPV